MKYILSIALQCESGFLFHLSMLSWVGYGLLVERQCKIEGEFLKHFSLNN